MFLLLSGLKVYGLCVFTEPASDDATCRAPGETLLETASPNKCTQRRGGGGVQTEPAAIVCGACEDNAGQIHVSSRGPDPSDAPALIANTTSPPDTDDVILPPPPTPEPASPASTLPDLRRNQA